MNYLEQEKILRKNTGMLPRSWDEATKGADYAQWLYKPKSDWQQGVEWFTELFLALFWFCIGTGFVGAIVYAMFLK